MTSGLYLLKRKTEVFSPDANNTTSSSLFLTSSTHYYLLEALIIAVTVMSYRWRRGYHRCRIGIDFVSTDRRDFLSLHLPLTVRIFIAECLSG